VVVIPNRKISGEILHNFGVIRQLSIEVGVAYDSDLAKVERTVREVLAQNAKVLKAPPPAYGIGSLGNSSVNLSIGPWVAAGDYGAATSELYRAILDAFRANQIEIPLPLQEIRVLPDVAKGMDRPVPVAARAS
jgi:small conductance mechanosensitive channel